MSLPESISPSNTRLGYPIRMCWSSFPGVPNCFDKRDLYGGFFGLSKEKMQCGDFFIPHGLRSIAHGNDALHRAYRGARHSPRRAVALASPCRAGWCSQYRSELQSRLGRKARRERGTIPKSKLFGNPGYAKQWRKPRPVEVVKHQAQEARSGSAATGTNKPCFTCRGR